MCAELYGREYALFEGVGGDAPLAGQVAHLRQLLDSATPAKRKAVLQHLTRCLQPVLEKALLHPPMTHRLIRELLEAAPGSVVADTVDTLAATGGSVLKMVHTHDGAAAACMALAYGSPRDRKRLVKGMKGYVWQMAENEWGNAVVATALSVVDDTSLTGKAVVGDIKGLAESPAPRRRVHTSKLEDYLAHRHARRVLLQLLAPDSGRYLPPATMEMLRPPRRTVLEAANKGAAGGDSDEEAEEGAQQGQQRKKKQQQGKKKQGQHEEGEEEAGDGHQQQQQENGGGEGEGQPQEMVERVLGESKKDPAARRAELLGAGPDGLGALLARAVAARAGELLRGQALRRLILASTEEGPGGDGARAFVRALWGGALRGRCQHWAGGHADKVLAALVVCGERDVAAEASEELRPLVEGDLDSWVTKHGGSGPPGAEGGGAAAAVAAKRKAGAAGRKPAAKEGGGSAAAPANGAAAKGSGKAEQQPAAKKARRKKG
ncbi:hypothetical protein MNEG_6384 [Monoraphidium neglectum]|uniref:Uncharacterized protein n=1 Tax=Monoraphidium neglectum TaxID=145388 RepID=A0A0D2MM12_9CHLO|nr:hypothetical protein MNEG_6384 [Monoraphidium neglectum]KIZ01582.1 hypothetical protein MNEG_6384 [Monoraphidium neglectum]|eukprot:XP_013900601.1 hypothetical protein MNEG_6384 [Monoraphidium neglectum]